MRIKIAVGDRVELQCAVDVHNFKTVDWLDQSFNNIKQSSQVKVRGSRTVFSRRRVLIWENITKADAGKYHCEVTKKKEQEKKAEDVRKEVLIEVHDVEFPVISSANVDSTIEKISGNPLRLECEAVGLPIPTLAWYKNGKDFMVNDETLTDKEVPSVRMSRGNSRIDFSSLKPEDAGTYKCVVTSRLGTAEKLFKLVVSGKDNNDEYLSIDDESELL